MVGTVKDMSPPVIRHRSQPDGITCGPTCLTMVAEALGRGRFDLDVHNVASMCGTNPETGTTHEGVAKALSGLGVDAARTLGRDAAVGALRGAGPGDMVLCRTLTNGMKHWVLAVPGGPDVFEVHDPWLGRRLLGLDWVLRLVAPRGHEVWAVGGEQRPHHVAVGPLVADGDVGTAVEEALAVCRPAFGRWSPNLRAHLGDVVQWEASRAVRVDGRVVGVYLLNEDSVLDRRFPEPEADLLRSGRTVEGVALAVLEGFRGRGYGRLLRDEPARLGYDHVWGMAMHELRNAEAWRKHRRVVERTTTHTVTAARLEGPVYEALRTGGLDEVLACRARSGAP